MSIHAVRRFISALNAFRVGASPLCDAPRGRSTMSGWALAPGPGTRGDLHRDEGRRVPGRVPGDEDGPTAVQMRALIILVMLLAWLAARVLLWW